MAYPEVVSPYGLKPQNAIGNANYTGTTRDYMIPYGYATGIAYGDAVGLTRGGIQRISVGNGSAGSVVGVFLGCYYTNPSTNEWTGGKQWPAGMLSGDAVAIVADDPDIVFKAVICSSGVVVASGSRAMIGQNLAMINNTGNLVTGLSLNAVLCPTATPATTATLPLRMMGLVDETKVGLGTVTYTSISTATVTCSALPKKLPVGTEVFSLGANGQMIPSGSFVATEAQAGATTVVLNQAPITAFVASSTLAFFQYPEILVKWNFGQHTYQTGTSIA